MKKNVIAKRLKHPLVSSTLILGGAPALANATYQEDLAFLKSHTAIIELQSGSARVAIAPAWQGRVMTSTATGPNGVGFGWINPPVIAAGIKPEGERTGLSRHIHVFGGEERLWFGPEGGPFALFFPAKVEQTFANWKTPSVIDTEAFEIASAPSKQSATFTKSTNLSNRAGTVFSMHLKRTVTLASEKFIAELCGGPLPEDVQAVGYTTENTLKNTGDFQWTRKTGAPSIWLLGMFKPTPETTMIIPFRPGDQADLGPIAKTDYFGKIPEDRIRIGKSAVFFKGDGRERGKIGIPPQRALGVAASWQPDSNTLTIIKTPLTPRGEGQAWPYVDSQWREDVDPYQGDLINAYNDGPPEPGADPLGPFYELESSSPALLLKPEQSHTHIQTTLHLTGPRQALDLIAQRKLGLTLEEIETTW